MNAETILWGFVGVALAVALDAAGLNPFTLLDAFVRSLVRRLTGAT